MSTLRELAAESIGRITRRSLEPQLTQIDAAIGPDEPVVAVAPGRDGMAGVVVVLTGERLLLSAGAPFARPDLTILPTTEISSATASSDADGWILTVGHPGGTRLIHGMFDRDAQRLAGLLTLPTG